MKFENWFGIVVGVFIVLFVAGIIYLARMDEKLKPEVIGELYDDSCISKDVDSVVIRDVRTKIGEVITKKGNTTIVFGCEVQSE